jgi:ABC-type branched-subunit amino acid transport system ATPase component
VVEHDMGFVSSIARTVTVLHEGRVLPKDRWTRSRTMNVIEVTGALTMLSVSKLNHFTEQPHAHDLDLEIALAAAPRVGPHGAARALLKCLMGAAGAFRRGALGWPGHCRCRYAPGLGSPCAAREIFPRLTVEENPLTGFAIKPQVRATFRKTSSTCFRVEGHAR